MKTLQIQNLLKYLFLEYGRKSLDPVYLDGIPGPKTEAAIRDFQSLFDGLTVTGQADGSTQKALRNAVSYGIEGLVSETDTPQQPEVGASAAEESYWEELKYFRRSDPYIACPCPRCGGFPVEPSEKLMRTAEMIRAHFNAPMIPSSTVRCQAHNDELPGSAKNSRHIQGKAMDFSIPGVPVKEVLAYTQSLQAGGELRYTYEMPGTGHVHIDVM